MKAYASPFEVSKVYDCSKNAVVKTNTVQFTELHKFGRLLKKLAQQLGETADDDFWSPILIEIRSFWHEICAAPLLDSYLHDRVRQVQDSIRTNQSACDKAYPDLAPYLKALGVQAQVLSTLKLDLLLDTVGEFVSDKKINRFVVVITRSRLIPQAEAALRTVIQSAHYEVLTAESLRGIVSYEFMIVLGSPYWFPSFVFSAPRTENLFIIRYRWLRAKPASEESLAAVLRHTGGSVPKFDIVESDNESDLEDDLMIPAFGVAYLEQVAAKHRAISDEESVVARALALEDGRLVFLEAEGASALIIDPQERAEKRVQRVETDHIEKGMFLLLRTEGGGDYILPVANRILGQQANNARQRQKYWKQLLRSAVRKNGIRAAVANLEHYGCTVAHEINVRHWMSDRSIKTKRQSDFIAIMQFIGLGDEADEYWKTMKEIDNAHKKAGFDIREMLLEQVDRSNLEELERLGTMTFELPDKDAGRLVAFRVKSVSGQTYIVSQSKLGEILSEV